MAKYTSDIAKLLEDAEKRGVTVHQWSTQKWEVNLDSGKDEEKITVSYQGTNLEDLLKRILKV